MTLSTPALLFPAISLLLLAYTNRFQVLAMLIRQLHEKQFERTGPCSEATRRQLLMLRQRLSYIKYMQALGIGSFILCTFSMFSLFIANHSLGLLLFGLSLMALVGSLLVALIETLNSTDALSVQLEEMDSK